MKIAHLSLLLLLLLFVGVGGYYLQSRSTPSTPSASIVPPSTTTLIFAHHMPKESVLHETALHFAAEVARKTQGAITVSVHPNQELGNSHEMLELSRLGKIDIVLTASAKVSTASPSMQFADLPFLFPTREDAYAMLDGKVGQMLLKELNAIDLMGVAFWDGGYKNITANRPITTLEDFTNLDVRVMKSRIIMEQYTALGAKPLPIDFHETKQALIDGIVDAQENPLSEIVTMGFHHVQSDVTLSHHSYLPYVLTFSHKSISKLPLAQQQILIECAQDATHWGRKTTHAKDPQLLETIQAAGVHIHTLSAHEKTRLQKATAHIMSQFEEVMGAHIVSKAQEYFYDQKSSDDAHIVIGIDADLSMGGKEAGLAIKRGAQLAIDRLNAQGGLLGKKVILLAKDHQGISTQAQENIDAFIKNPHTLAILGGKHSAIISSYVDTLQKSQMLFFSPWGAAPSIIENGYSDNYLFRVSLNDKEAAKFLTHEALKKGKNPLIIVENSLWGKEALEGIQRTLNAQGIGTFQSIILNRGETDFGAIREALARHENDVILMVLNSQEAQKSIEVLHESAPYLPIVSHWGMVGNAFYKANKTLLQKIDLRFIQTFSFLKNPNKESKQLAQNYMHDYAKTAQEHINVATGVAQAYDTVMLLAHAVQKAQSLERPKVKAALEAIERHEGVIKTYRTPFTATMHDALRQEDFFMAKFDNNGNIVPLRK
ncbi:MAG: hypothetical protein KU37_08730 [Sulfuricurvum sp. PC08-66]|nr:MAG: hypothetical protein KU37_08730 [Sulfuricurvum sp. PC08-66]